MLAALSRMEMTVWHFMRIKCAHTTAEKSQEIVAPRDSSRKYLYYVNRSSIVPLFLLDRITVSFLAAFGLGKVKSVLRHCST